MPKVGSKSFGYGKKGMAAAEKEAKRTGKKVERKPMRKMPMKKK